MNDETAAFERDVLAACAALIAEAGPCGRLIVALSGGRDSTVLLHAMTRLRARLAPALAAIHLDHALQPASAGWAAACAARCAAYGVPLISARLDQRPGVGDSIEAWARAARYAFFGQALGPQDLLITAHHQDDNAETFLLNALRGSGPAGLRGIASLRPLGRGWLGRPLLAIDATRIARYAEAQKLMWDVDPMNASLRLSRAFLRDQVLPLLRQHWPAASRALARTAARQRTAVKVNDAFADRLLDTVVPRGATTLPLHAVQDLTPDLQATVLRRWIARAALPIPDSTHVERMQTCVLGARADRIPTVTWKGACLKRYRGTLYLLAAAAPALPPFEHRWQPPDALLLPGGVLSAQAVNGAGLRADTTAITVRSRRGGERCRLPGRSGHHTLKHLLQSSRVPPWTRSALPLIFVGDTLAAVADLFVCADFVAGPGQAGWMLCWRPHDALPAA